MQEETPDENQQSFEFDDEFFKSRKDSDPDFTKDKFFEKALKTSKTFRIAVSGDVLITELERKIIDTEHFQRLRRVRQLGSVNFVYPTALHTRFDHCLGTMAMAERMMAEIEGNTHSQPYERKIQNDERILVRLYALLHDIPHVPFGHTIEDELGLFIRHDKNIPRLKLFLGTSSEIGKLISRHLGPEMYKRFWSIYLWDGETQELKEDEDKEASEEIADANYSVKKIDDYYVVTAKADKNGKKETKVVTLLEKPGDAFIYDLVSNTVCADLLDYLARDSYFCNLGSVLEYRFLNFLYLENIDGLKRVLVRLWKQDKKPRRDTLTDLTRLLEARYLVAERAYFHHAKIISGAMLGRALYEDKKNITEESLYHHSDDTLLNALKESKNKNKIPQTLGKFLWNRNLYKSYLSYSEDDFAGAQSKDHRKNSLDIAFDLVEKPEKRVELENKLADEIGAEPGNIIIYAPDRKMNMKAAGVKVLWKGATIPLKDIDDKVVKPRLNQILDAHQMLWAIHIFVAPLSSSDGEYDEDRNGGEPEDILERLERLTVLTKEQLELLKDACDLRFLYPENVTRKRRYYEKLIEYDYANSHGDNVVPLALFKKARLDKAKEMLQEDNKMAAREGDDALSLPKRIKKAVEGIHSMFEELKSKG